MKKLSNIISFNNIKIIIKTKRSKLIICKM